MFKTKNYRILQLAPLLYTPMLSPLKGDLAMHLNLGAKSR